MTLPIWLDNPGERVKDELDVAIIGGGMIGAGCAYLLSRRRGLRVGLVEARGLAGGSTGRSAGFVLRGIQPYYNQVARLYGRENARGIFAFAEESQAMVREFLSGRENTFDYVPCGSYLLASSLEELEYLKEDPIDRDFFGAIYNPGDFGVHPARLVEALVTAGGASVWQNEPVLKIHQEDTDEAVVQTPHRTIACRRVLLATNAYAALLEPYFRGKIQCARGQALVTQPLRKSIVDRLCYANYGWEYFRQLPDRRLLLGGCRQLHLEEEVGYAEVVTAPVQESLERYLKDRFPDVAGVTIDYRWAGLMGFTSDGLPLVGRLKQMPSVFFAVACNGHGLGYGLNMSRLLTETALDGRHPGIFSVDRESLAPPSQARTP